MVEIEFDERLNMFSGEFGCSKEELVKRAVFFYIESMRQKKSFEDELRMWDELSDDALIKFEEKL
ncbi:MAG: hypothetical protein KJ592_03455 [Nanoarchaeota archaeon]|nr:hypothetical protein [Nanoarchaeota archaeon]